MKAYIRARKFDKVGTLVTWLQGYMCSNVSWPNSCNGMLARSLKYTSKWNMLDVLQIGRQERCYKLH